MQSLASFLLYHILMQVYRIFYCFCHNILASFCRLNSDKLDKSGGIITGQISGNTGGVFDPNGNIYSAHWGNQWLSTVINNLQTQINANVMTHCEATITKTSARDMTKWEWHTIPIDTLTDTTNYSVSNGVITIKNAGYYSITAKGHIGVAASTYESANPVNMQLVINGLPECSVYATPFMPEAAQMYLSCNYIGYLPANSTVYIPIYVCKDQPGGLYGKGSQNKITIVKLHD